MVKEVRKVKATGYLRYLLDHPDPKLQARTSARMGFAVKIANAMKERGISQKELAKRMGKCTSEISEWLSGNRNFTIDTITDISEALGVDLLTLPYEKTRTVPNTSVAGSIGKSSAMVRGGSGAIYAAPLVEDNFIL